MLDLLPRELLGSLEIHCRHPRTAQRSPISNVSGDSRERRLCSRGGTRRRGHAGFEEWWWRRKHPRVFHMGEHLEGGSQLELSARDPQRAEAISHCEIAARLRRAPYTHTEVNMARFVRSELELDEGLEHVGMESRGENFATWCSAGRWTRRRCTFRCTTRSFRCRCTTKF